MPINTTSTSPESSPEPSPENGKQGGLLNAIERIGNALPDPASLFLIGVVCVFAFSWLASYNGWESVPAQFRG